MGAPSNRLGVEAACWAAAEEADRGKPPELAWLPLLKEGWDAGVVPKLKPPPKPLEAEDAEEVAPAEGGGVAASWRSATEAGGKAGRMSGFEKKTVQGVFRGGPCDPKENADGAEDAGAPPKSEALLDAPEGCISPEKPPPKPPPTAQGLRCHLACNTWNSDQAWSAGQLPRTQGAADLSQWWPSDHAWSTWHWMFSAVRSLHPLESCLMQLKMTLILHQNLPQFQSWSQCSQSQQVRRRQGRCSQWRQRYSLLWECCISDILTPAVRGIILEALVLLTWGLANVNRRWDIVRAWLSGFPWHHHCCLPKLKPVPKLIVLICANWKAAEIQSLVTQQIALTWYAAKPSNDAFPVQQNAFARCKLQI